MAITLGSNIASLRGQRQLSRTSEELSTVFQRLSSGQRINRASDDAAGLAIADALGAKSRIYGQGIRNLNDGLSLLNIADSTIESLSEIAIRLEELATQSANGVYSVKQRKAMDDEAQALSREFFRISKITEFNGQKLFTGDLQSVNLQAGVGANAVLSAGVGGAIGTGSVGSAVSYAGESASSAAVAVGDLNGDGFLDLITAGNTGTAGYATIRLGTGGGSFGASASYATGENSVTSLSLGDVNGDGVLDLVTAGIANSGYGNATIRLGIGNGSFGAMVTYRTENNVSYALSLGDINNDGILDLVTAGLNLFEGRATVRLGSGNGTFGAATSYTTEGDRSRALTLGDVNGDGILDIVTAGYANGGDAYTTIRLGSGNGSFGTALSYFQEYSWTGNGHGGVALGDVNGDGKLDLITASAYATMRLGNGNGTFRATATYATESYGSAAVSFGDMNGDGFLDVITAGYSSTGAGYATIQLGNGNGTFRAGASYSTEDGGSTAVALGDANGDGVLDVVTAGYSTALSAGRATIRTGNTRDGVAPILPFSLRTLADARQALPIFKRKRELLAEQRGEIGAFQSRIDVARNVLDVSSENFKAAESRIRDADIADESSRLVRLGILQQAASAILAQANQQPSLALQLLR